MYPCSYGYKVGTRFPGIQHTKGGISRGLVLPFYFIGRVYLPGRRNFRSPAPREELGKLLPWKSAAGSPVFLDLCPNNLDAVAWVRVRAHELWGPRP